jgi:tetratricopeptide (TPR) repeat protein
MKTKISLIFAIVSTMSFPKTSVNCMKNIILIAAALFISCNSNTIKSIDTDKLGLKRGAVISCGSQEGQLFGNVSFDATIPAEFQKDFNTGIALLHSFEYDEAEKMFAKVIDEAPDCAMAYWGVAMSNFHPLWAPPSQPELQKGLQVIQVARSIKNKTKKEAGYIEAIAQFYEQFGELDHRTRVLKFEKAMEDVYRQYADDTEAAIFYALALNAAVDPTDKTYSRQRKAFETTFTSGHCTLYHSQHGLSRPGRISIARSKKICKHSSCIGSCTAYAFTYFHKARVMG